MTSYEHKVKNIYLGGPLNYSLLRWPCDEWFHVPLKEERESVLSVWFTKFTFREHLHAPFSWYIANSGNRVNPEEIWQYWTVSPNATSPNGNYVRSLDLCKLDDFVDWWTYGYRCYWYNIRAFKDAPVIPDETRTETLTWKVWYNSTLWLISVLVGTNQYVTMQDKNVWATEVYNYNESTLNNNNRWQYFQRWNNYGFNREGELTTSSTQVNTTGYWPNNQYRSYKFITNTTGSYNRSNPKNDNLRWYTDFNS